MRNYSLTAGGSGQWVAIRCVVCSFGLDGILTRLIAERMYVCVCPKVNSLTSECAAPSLNELRAAGWEILPTRRPPLNAAKTSEFMYFSNFFTRVAKCKGVSRRRAPDKSVSNKRRMRETCSRARTRSPISAFFEGLALPKKAVRRSVTNT